MIFSENKIVAFELAEKETFKKSGTSIFKSTKKEGFKEVIPIEIIEQKIQGINAADQCDQITSLDLKLRSALETVLDWYDSYDYSEYVERWINNGE